VRTRRGLLPTGLVLLVAAAAAEDRPLALVTLHYIDNPKEAVRLWIFEYDEEGMRARRMSGRRDFRVAWNKILRADRERLRRKFRLDLTETELKGLVDGVCLHLVGGGRAEGVLESTDGKGQRWLRRRGQLLPYPKDRVEQVEPVLVPEAEVFTPQVVYERQLERLRPKTAERHRELADSMYELGNFKRAKQHYAEAQRLEPSWRWKLKPRLTEVETLIRDKRLAAVVRKSRKLAYLDHRYDAARQVLQQGLGGADARSRLLLRALENVDELERERHEREYHQIKNRETRRVLEDFLRKKQPSLDEALAFVTSSLEDAVAKRVKARIEATDEEIERLKRSAPSGAAHWATYRDGSFVFDPVAKRGKSSSAAIRGDPDRWWNRYNDAASRSSFLRAYAAEKLPRLFEVVRVRYSACAACGGSGQVKRSSVRQVRTVRGNSHEWMENCPRCFGCGRDRAVAYR
jgi:tetratricopeptide (TPR) repeat protein